MSANPTREEAVDGLHKLEPDELVVAYWTGKGLSASQIALKMGKSTATARAKRTQVYQKLNLNIEGIKDEDKGPIVKTRYFPIMQELGMTDNNIQLPPRPVATIRVDKELISQEPPREQTKPLMPSPIEPAASSKSQPETTANRKTRANPILLTGLVIVILVIGALVIWKGFNLLSQPPADEKPSAAVQRPLNEPSSPSAATTIEAYNPSSNTPSRPSNTSIPSTPTGQSPTNLSQPVPLLAITDSPAPNIELTAAYQTIQVLAAILSATPVPPANTPLPTSTPSPTLPPTPQLPILFQSNFDSSPDWQVVSGNPVYSENQMLVKDNVTVVFGDPAWDNFEVTWDTLPHTYVYGCAQDVVWGDSILLRYIDPNNFVALCWDKTTSYWWIYNKGQKAKIEALPMPNGKVHLSVKAVVESFTLEISGQHNTIIAPGKTRGRIGLQLLNEAVISNLRVYSLK